MGSFPSQNATQDQEIASLMKGYEWLATMIPNSVLLPYFFRDGGDFGAIIAGGAIDSGQKHHFFWHISFGRWADMNSTRSFFCDCEDLNYALEDDEGYLSAFQITYLHTLA